MKQITILLTDRGVKEAFFYRDKGDIQDLEALTSDGIGYMVVEARIIEKSPLFDLDLD